MFDLAGRPEHGGRHVRADYPRSLTLFVRPQERAARVEVRAVGGREAFVVTVAPAASGGWHVTDPTDPEPTWRATWPAAIGEAIAQASTALEDPGNPSVEFHGEKRSNKTHQSTTDPDAQLMRKGKGKEARLVFMGHALMENRHGLLVDFQVTHATGTAERDMVPKLLDQAKERHFHPKALGGDKNYDTQDCVADIRERRVTPHVAQNTSGRRSAIDGRTTRHPGYAASQRIRKRVEEVFGWMKTIGGFRRTRYRGLDRTGLAGYLVATAYNLVRLSRLRARSAAMPAAA